MITLQGRLPDYQVSKMLYYSRNNPVSSVLMILTQEKETKQSLRASCMACTSHSNVRNEMRIAD